MLRLTLFELTYFLFREKLNQIIVCTIVSLKINITHIRFHPNYFRNLPEKCFKLHFNHRIVCNLMISSQFHSIYHIQLLLYVQCTIGILLKSLKTFEKMFSD